jgi:hypothetical protein
MALREADLVHALLYGDDWEPNNLRNNFAPEEVVDLTLEGGAGPMDVGDGAESEELVERPGPEYASDEEEKEAPAPRRSRSPSVPRRHSGDVPDAQPPDDDPYWGEERRRSRSRSPSVPSRHSGDSGLQRRRSRSRSPGPPPANQLGDWYTS